ncbi:ABC transporter permease [Nonomuraea sp. M3C6]|uniref:ABC transporter permease n=1 Tax=Nonomuraea marmarensis TaxID=3351344 RepID=A0ABW7AS64_9ACTN
MLEVTELLASALRFATPLIFAALGGILCERAGVVNIGLEGLMLTGAFFGVLGAHLTGSAWAGLLLAVVAGVLLASLHAVASIRFGAEQIISGTAVNLLALGGTSYLLPQVFGSPGSSPQVTGFGSSPVPLLHDIPVLGPALFGQQWFVWAGPLCALVIGWFLVRTVAGLRLRASGEAPRVLEAAGVRVLPLRYAAVAASGALCGVAGAYLSLGLLSGFSANMTAGRGFMALAAVILGGWRPLRSMAAALFFGLAGALVIRLPQDAVDLQILDMIPYVATILVLVVFSRGVHGPAAVGRPYRPGAE